MENSIIQNNKMIASFMGIIERSGHWYYEDAPQFNTSMVYKEDALNYHSSWDWLMPVIQKILTDMQSSCILEHPGYCNYPSGNKNWGFSMCDDCTTSQSGHNEVLITAAYDAVVAYIKHYERKEKI